MAPLATVLNSIEVGLPVGTAWVANRYTDTGGFALSPCCLYNSQAVC